VCPPLHHTPIRRAHVRTRRLHSGDEARRAAGLRACAFHPAAAVFSQVTKLTRFKEGAVDWEALEEGLKAKLQAATRVSGAASR
jgi:hypothetical protein